MKATLFIFFLFLSMHLSAQIEKSSSLVVIDKDGASKIGYTIDLGESKLGDTLSFKFTVKNISKKTIFMKIKCSRFLWLDNPRQSPLSPSSSKEIQGKIVIKSAMPNETVKIYADPDAPSGIPDIEVRVRATVNRF